MKVLFLDIDGVLNSTDNTHVRWYLWGQDTNIKSKDQFGTLFDERCVLWLQYIILQTGCKIVLSSSWRHMGLNKVKLMWELRNLPGEVIDITPLEYDPAVVELYADVNPNADRGYEIQEWLDNNLVESYCIVDDEDDMLSSQKFVRTDQSIGLNRKTSNEIIQILNSKE